MAITPNPPADFTPTQGNYKSLQPFRYWCQKVLPLVYDDSLSYYELLCKVVDYLNKTMEDVETLHDDVDNLHTAYEELQDYVNDYFSTLDVQQEINNKLDVMAQDGTLSALIEPYVQPAVNVKIDALVDNGTMAQVVSPFVPPAVRDKVDSMVTDGTFGQITNPQVVTATNNKVNSMVSSGEFAQILDPKVQPAVNTKINNMVSDGSFAQITDPKVVQETDSWLGDHITNPSNPPLDTSLLLANAAAPAKTVGDLAAISRGSITGALSSYTKQGWYYFEDGTAITDLPSDFNTANNGCLIVISPSVNHLYSTQILEDASNHFWYRYCTLSGTPTAWKKIITSHNIEGELFNTTNTLVDKTGTYITNDIKSNKTTGWFNYDNTNSGITDLPSNAASAGLLLNLQHSVNRNMLTQVIQDVNGRLWTRIISIADNSYIGSWMQIANDATISYRGGVDSNLSNYRNSGWYKFDAITGINDLPSDFSGTTGCLLVFNPSVNYAQTTQILQDTSNHFWFRYCAISDGTATSWKRIVSSHNLMAELEQTTNTLVAKTTNAITGSLSNYRDSGWYNFPNGNNISDLPSDFATANNGCLLVLKPSINYAYCTQILMDASNHFWYRYCAISDGTSTAWKRIITSHNLNGELLATDNLLIEKTGTTITTPLENVVNSGWYYFSNGGNITDLPNGCTSAGMLLVLRKSVTVAMNVQLVYDQNGRSWTRISSLTPGSYTSEWIMLTGKAEYHNALTLKNWYACGDSFTHGDFDGITPAPTIGKGKYKNNLPVYPFFIGNRNDINVVDTFMQNGATLAMRTDASTGYSLAEHYTDIPNTADYITLYYGINDAAHCTLGTITDATVNTFYGALNVICEWILTNRPNAHLGLIASNSVNVTFTNAVKEVGEKWGIPVLDMNDTSHMLVIGSNNVNVSDAAKALANSKFRVSESNGHPNALCHELQSHFIEEWLLSL